MIKRKPQEVVSSSEEYLDKPSKNHGWKSNKEIREEEVEN